MIKHKVEGYWYSEQEPHRPKPIPNALTDKESREIFLLIREKEKRALKRRSKGSSKSRITGERLGNVTFQTNEFSWPGDFAEHYVLTHKVMPSQDFLEFIGYSHSIKTVIN